MSETLNINDILSRVKKMDKTQQNSLLQKLKLLLENTESNKDVSHRLTSLTGLGSDLWKNLDIDKYVEEERQW